MPPSIRPAVPADEPAVSSLVRAAYEPWIPIVGMRPQPMDADNAASIAAGHVHVQCDETGTVIGVIFLVPEPGVLLIENVAVSPDLQGAGLGKRLLAFAESQARSLGLPSLRLYTHRLMASNIARYEALGYEQVSHPGETRPIVHLSKPVP